jgi:hypothetical protein
MNKTEPLGCGDCRLCCKLLEVQEIDKPFLKWCPHAKAGTGCSIYADRPQSCRTFVCTWLASQSRVVEERMTPELRPDRCGVIFAPIDEVDPEGRLHVHVDPNRPMAWARKDVKRWLERIVSRGITIILSVGEKRTTLRRDLPNMHGRAVK